MAVLAEKLPAKNSREKYKERGGRRGYLSVAGKLVGFIRPFCAFNPANKKLKNTIYEKFCPRN